MTQDIFVFGSNKRGIHGAGAAKEARDKWGAKMGISVGPTGFAYAIPTKNEPTWDKRQLPLEEIHRYVDDLISYALKMSNTKFLVTRIGCGLAGYKDEEIGPMFSKAPSNVVFVGSDWEKYRVKKEYTVKKTTVINIKNAPAGWDDDPEYVYIGRPSAGQGGEWGNPHPIGKFYCDICGYDHDRQDSIRRYEEDFRESLKDSGFRNRLLRLKGKILVCFCKPLDCHGDVIAYELNNNQPDPNDELASIPAAALADGGAEANRRETLRMEETVGVTCPQCGGICRPDQTKHDTCEHCAAQLNLSRDPLFKYYAGIGSRETPRDVLKVMKDIGYVMAKKGLVLRSGNADGADQAFHLGCEVAKGRAQIFLPWNNFNENFLQMLYSEGIDHDRIKLSGKPSEEAIQLAIEAFPWLARAKPGVQKLQGRNMHQVLGPDLKTPVEMVICWAEPDGSNGKVKGGTNYAVTMANESGIKVYNLYYPEMLAGFKKRIETLGATGKGSDI